MLTLKMSQIVRGHHFLLESCHLILVRCKCLQDNQDVRMWVWCLVYRGVLFLVQTRQLRTWVLLPSVNKPPYNRERHNAAKPVQVDPKTGKPLPATAVPPRAASPSLDGDGGGFFGSFWATKNKKKMAAMEPPPPTLKASSTLNEKETQEVEVIKLISRGTIEELVHKACEKKLELANRVTGWEESAEQTSKDVEKAVKEMLLAGVKSSPPQSPEDD